MSSQGSVYPDRNISSSNTQVADLAPGSLSHLLALRRRFEEGQDRFSERELAQLRFVRWLFETGRLTA